MGGSSQRQMHLKNHAAFKKHFSTVKYSLIIQYFAEHN
jgi:hypothetical protein